MSPNRLSASDSAVLVIDVQERLLPHIPQTPSLLLNLTFLLDAAQLLEVPVLATEQYPKGLGSTAPVLAERLPRHLPAKVAFSCAAVPEITKSFSQSGRTSVILAGIETHVCVLQTALDLIERDLTVFVAVDAVAGRFDRDHDLALRRMERAGAVLTTVETSVFEWLGTAGAPQFKAVSGLVQERMRRLQSMARPEIRS